MEKVYLLIYFVCQASLAVICDLSNIARKMCVAFASKINGRKRFNCESKSGGNKSGALISNN
jgi:hypothetical protein